MNKFFGFLILIFCSLFSYSQNVGVGTNTPHASAALEVKDSAKGILIPRMTMTQRNAIQNPAEGLMVYQTDSTKGIWLFTSLQWKLLNHRSTLQKCTVIQSNTPCPFGGSKVECGIDLNENQILDSIEINNNSTVYICKDDLINGGSNFTSISKYDINGTYTWNKPAGVSKVIVECWGAGASGRYYLSHDAGSGGGYGKSIIDVSAISSVTIKVGKGGIPTLNNFGAGGSSSFGNYLISTGGTDQFTPGTSNGNIISITGEKGWNGVGGSCPNGGSGGVPNNSTDANGVKPGGGAANFYLSQYQSSIGNGADGMVIVYY